MTVSLSDHALSYVSVPKCACTSLKAFFFEIENGRPFKQFRLNGTTYYVHDFARSVRFEELDRASMRRHRRIAVVRDPVSRLASCYANKVVGERALERPAPRAVLEDRQLTPTPTFGEFVRNLGQYKAASPHIRHHSRRLRHFLGPDPAFYDRIFSIRSLPDLRAFVGDIVGPVPALPHAQRSASWALLDELGAADRRRIERIYAADIDMFGAYM